MSLWTPSGEHPVDRERSAAPSDPSRPPTGPPGDQGEPSLEDLTPEQRAQYEEMARQMEEAQARMLQLPAGMVVGQQTMLFYVLAALYLSQQPPRLEDARVAIDRSQASRALRLEGLHMHIGSQILDLDPFRAAVAAVSHLGDFPVYNLGGGLGAAYTADQRPPSIEEYVAAKVGAVEEFIGPGKRILDEPGRALVANSCVTLYTVQSVKRNVSTWVAVDGGMSDNMRPLLYGSRYEAQVVDRFGGGTRCHLTGKHCESGDIVAADVELDSPRAGDVVVTPATGAYGYSMANNYNGARRAPVVFAKDGDARLVVRRETLEELYSRDV